MIDHFDNQHTNRTNWFGQIGCEPHLHCFHGAVTSFCSRTSTSFETLHTAKEKTQRTNNVLHVLAELMTGPRGGQTCPRVILMLRTQDSNAASDNTATELISPLSIPAPFIGSQAVTLSTRRTIFMCTLSALRSSCWISI